MIESTMAISFLIVCGIVIVLIILEPLIETEEHFDWGAFMGWGNAFLWCLIYLMSLN